MRALLQRGSVLSLCHWYIILIIRHRSVLRRFWTPDQWPTLCIMLPRLTDHRCLTPVRRAFLAAVCASHIPALAGGEPNGKKQYSERSRLLRGSTQADSSSAWPSGVFG
ncbi:hypothetical protein M431DRAFT_360995 [Trichoderma harzianum CBS 226.95]|uniref:Uncharacterized protein n=1 Tax=Trichoderma harzianum CBS 226.95 TaxID=983964 RepID=A0A2T4AMC9_TRIHA|nr:hypothetical protein M431DRAFT_360995 [Trichoderma harzianum CBS 226.95]PTB58225.1 hypothetical protein M431DRAFT_360995 [Trichoderma harzianum CBS 226.95]